MTTASVLRAERMIKKDLSNFQLHSLLRGELSALEAYESTMEKFADEPELYRLKALFRNHRGAVRYWEKEALKHSASNAEEFDSGVWGTVVAGLVETAKWIGEESALTLLLRGEEHGLEQYKSASSSRELTKPQKETIRNLLIPNQEAHISCLRSLIRLQK